MGRLPSALPLLPTLLAALLLIAVEQLLLASVRLQQPNIVPSSYSTQHDSNSPATTDLSQNISVASKVPPPSGRSSTTGTASTGSSTIFPPYIFYNVIDKSNIGIKESFWQSRCKKLNPRYDIRLFDDADRRQFISEHYPQFLDLYDGFTIGVMRADMWRYLILHKYGGVYLDSDIDCREPIEQWADLALNMTAEEASSSTLGAMVGIEVRGRLKQDNQTDDMPLPIQFAVWTMAAKPGHPIFLRTVESIKATVAKIKAGGKRPGNEETHIVYTTGPGKFTEVVIEFLIQHGRLRKEQYMWAPGKDDIFRHLVDDPTIQLSTTMIIDDLAILCKNGFAMVKRWKEIHGPTIPLVHHRFAGSWKKKTAENVIAKNVHAADPSSKLNKRIDLRIHR